jgi:glyoxylase-like metal-dependent hydrolase (beta-lactamase superfamily II)
VDRTGAPVQQNCSVVWCTKTMRGAMVDPGGEIETLLAAANERGVTIEKVLVTHGHLDHAG